MWPVELVLSRESFADAIKRAAFPGMMSNHHLHNVAGLAVAFAELMEFGKDYTGQILKNAKTLAQALHERGFHVIAEQKGFTESHTILVDITETPLKDGSNVEETLEDAISSLTVTSCLGTRREVGTTRLLVVFD
ncbi:MAG: hypothetical protein RTU92_12900 [Candidatus Thorarchaeota archaeon]